METNLIKLEEVEIQKIISISRGKQLPKEERGTGKIIVIGAGKKSPYTTSISNYKSNTITISSSGAYAGYVSMHNYPIWASDCTVIEIGNEELLDRNYLYLFLLSKQEIIYSFQVGAGQPHVYWKNIKTIKIPLPPLAKQKAIAKKLDLAQKLIELRKQSITKLDELAKSVFVEMFGDPVENEMGWEVKKLKNVLVNIDGGWSPVCNSNARKNNNNAILKLSALTNDAYNQLENKEMKIDCIPKLDTMVKKGDLLFSRKNTYMLVGSSAYVFETKPNLFLPDLIFRLKTMENINPIFLWKYLTNDMVKIGLRNLSNGAAASMPNISKSKLLGFKINLPPLPLQNKFAQTIQAIEAQKVLYEKELVKLEESFAGLLQESFV